VPHNQTWVLQSPHSTETAPFPHKNSKSYVIMIGADWALAVSLGITAVEALAVLSPSPRPQRVSHRATMRQSQPSRLLCVVSMSVVPYRVR